jgi:hypothetical protein
VRSEKREARQSPDEDFEMVAVAVNGRDTKFTWEIVGIYRAPYEDMPITERLATRNSTKHSFIAGD